MLNRILFVALIVFTFNGCELEDITAPFNFEKDAPAWLKIKIDSLSIDPYFYMVKVFRYEWRDKFIYYFMNPVSSCAYCSCDLFDQNGNELIFSDDKILQDFIMNKKNKILVWEWKP